MATILTPVALGPVEGADHLVQVDGGAARHDHRFRRGADQGRHPRPELLAEREPRRFGRQPAVDALHLPGLEGVEHGPLGILGE